MADDFLEPKHRPLYLIATIAGVFAGLALFYFLVRMRRESGPLSLDRPDAGDEVEEEEQLVP